MIEFYDADDNLTDRYEKQPNREFHAWEKYSKNTKTNKIKANENFLNDEYIDFKKRNSIKKRLSEYPEIRDQFDMLYHDLKTIYPESSWIKAIKKVKDDNPL